MLDVSRTKPNGPKINWVQPTAQNFRLEKKYDLIIMTGNAFQVFLLESDLQAVFKTMSSHLKPGGLIAFETRNPELDWKNLWNYEEPLTTPDGVVIESRKFHSFDGPRMKFELTYQFPNEVLTSQSELRFWCLQEIESFAHEAGLLIERLMGDWDRKDFDPCTSKEMVFLMRKKN